MTKICHAGTFSVVTFTEQNSRSFPPVSSGSLGFSSGSFGFGNGGHEDFVTVNANAILTRPFQIK